MSSGSRFLRPDRVLRELACMAPRNRIAGACRDPDNGRTTCTALTSLRLSIALAVAGFIALVTGIYEIDRREKSSSETVSANIREIDQRVQVLSEQLRILSEQSSTQLGASERQVRALGDQIQSLDARLKEIEGKSSIGRPEPAPSRR